MIDTHDDVHEARALGQAQPRDGHETRHSGQAGSSLTGQPSVTCDGSVDGGRPTQPPTSPLATSLLASNHVGVCIASPNGAVSHINDALCQMVGIQLADAHKHNLFDLLAMPGAVQELLDALSDASGALCYRAEIHPTSQGPRHIQVECIRIALSPKSEQPLLFLVQDVSLEHDLAVSLSDIDQRQRAFATHAREAFAIMDAGGEVRYVSDALETILGFTPAHFVGTSPLDLALADGFSVAAGTLRELAETPLAELDIATRLHHADGSERWLDIHFVNRSDVAATNGIVITARDVTRRKLFEQRLEQLAYFDTLTSLPNRTRFRESLASAIEAIPSHGKPVAVIIVDLDRFKMINDRFGHDTGDDVLIAVGQRLVDSIQERETVARLGGDEFAVIVERSSAREAMRTAQRILSSLSQPFPDHHRVFNVEASAGVAVIGDTLHTLTDLVRGADIALYHAKSLGGGVATLYQRSMYEAVIARADLERSLQRALERDEIVPYYQPEFDLASGEIVNLEVLMHWQRSAGEDESPAEFVRVANETGIIIPFGRHLLRRACADLVAWNASRPDRRPVSISINVSAREYAQPDFPAWIDSILKETGLDSALLGIEIDDRYFREDSPELDRFVDSIRGLGIRLIVDGYSGGHATFARIRDIAPSRLKTAALAIDSMASPEIDQANVVMVTTIARHLNLPITAVGLESDALIHYARASGCQRVQCNLLQAPVPSTAVAALLDTGAVCSIVG